MNTFMHRCRLAIVVGAMTFVSHAWAQELRIGFVNTDRVLKEANTAKAAQVKLEQEFLKREKEITDLGTSVKSMTDKLERETPTLSDSQRVARQKQLVEQDRDFQRKRREFQEDLSARRNEELQQVLERANKVIRQLAESEKLDLVMQPDQVVYINPKHDITDKVIKALNAVGAK
jgi:outer membrane protein